MFVGSNYTKWLSYILDLLTVIQWTYGHLPVHHVCDVQLHYIGGTCMLIGTCMHARTRLTV